GTLWEIATLGARASRPHAGGTPALPALAQGFFALTNSFCCFLAASPPKSNKKSLGRSPNDFDVALQRDEYEFTNLIC
ncbi:hypothetical protein CJ255_14060, partial [Candidatus Viridilinea mediisalina]